MITTLTKTDGLTALEPLRPTVLVLQSAVMGPRGLPGKQGPAGASMVDAVAQADVKLVPADTDLIPLIDSENQGILKKLTWGNLKAKIKDYFDTLYQSVLSSGVNIKTVNGVSLLGSGNIAVAAEGSSLGGTAVVNAAGTVTLTTASAVYQFINPNGAARDVVLPTPGASAQATFVIKNTGTAGNALKIKTAGGVQVGVLLANGYSQLVVWSGTVWEAL